ncbi:hypothetical protein [Massilia sp. 9I]|uniref:hypothetical protein n=1 Tax=Massilia sp. 9I TaxID=2653152 RepID=UPI0012F0BFBB|nr:hypothetical protein [Massilia sp. 9I]VXC36934.1 conserved hypothetical protein [Massilia sp. 9I]
MKRPVLGTSARPRLKLFGASALMLLLTACGDHPPKDDDEEQPPPPAQQAITIVAGSATDAGSANGSGTAARFNTPSGIAIDSAGNLYVADSGNDLIRKITPAGAVTTLAGAVNSNQYVDGAGDRARFVEPLALAIDSNGTLYVTDDMRIRSVASNGQVGTYATIPVGSNVTAASMPAVKPKGIAVDPRGQLLVTNGLSTRRFAGGTVMLEGPEVAQDLMGTRNPEARGVATDSSSNVYVFDLQRTISRTNSATIATMNVLNRLAGSPNARGAANGSASAASFEEVVALTVDPQGNVYAADAVNNLVRRITPAGVVSTVAGTARSATLQAGNLPGTLAPLRGITNDGKGNLYATSGNAVIKIKLP